MNYYLAKTDPESYSIDDLAKDKETVWDGVHNYQALIHIRKMKKGDRMLIYHSLVKGKEGPGIVGLADIISDARENLKDTRKSWVVDVRFRKKFDKTITLQSIKETDLFNDWSLIKQGRLSTMPVPEKFITWLSKIEKLSFSK